MTDAVRAALEAARVALMQYPSDDLNAVHARGLINAALADTGWRDMESAPRDGTAILIYQPDMPERDTLGGGIFFDCPRYAIGYWRTYVRADGREYGGWGNRNCAHVNPTRWQPLPPLPKEPSHD